MNKFIKEPFQGFFHIFFFIQPRKSQMQEFEKETFSGFWFLLVQKETNDLTKYNKVNFIET